MKLNECLICFEKIKKIDKIASSHGDIKHPGYYHKKCIIQYMKQYDNVPPCPLCRGNYIVNIPGYCREYKIKEFNINVSESRNIINFSIDNTRLLIYNNATNFTIYLNYNNYNYILIFQFILRYGIQLYFLIYFYVLSSTMAWFSVHNRSLTHERRRYIFDVWLRSNNLILFFIHFELIYIILYNVIDELLSKIPEDEITPINSRIG